VGANIGIFDKLANQK